jgi:hypothetical protein
MGMQKGSAFPSVQHRSPSTINIELWITPLDVKPEGEWAQRKPKTCIPNLFVRDYVGHVLQHAARGRGKAAGYRSPVQTHRT